MTQIVRFYNNTRKRYLCFKHAVVQAAKGDDIDADVDDQYPDEYDMRDTTCELCVAEEKMRPTYERLLGKPEGLLQ